MAEELSDNARAAVRDLILGLADAKRLLGTRYAGWILGAPEIETGIACASMAQDEWGHGRLLYSLLRDFDDDVDRLEHGREPHEYANPQVLDEAPESWSDLVALIAFTDTALSVQVEAFRESSYVPMRQRVEKMLEEERFHAAHGAAWIRRLAGASRDTGIAHAAASVVPPMLQWFGPDSERARELVAQGVVDAAGGGLRSRYADAIRPLLEAIGRSDLLDANPSFDGFDESSRRTSRTGPDADTIRKVRGDRNRAFLMD